jgi:hypothetical protein
VSVTGALANVASMRSTLKTCFARMVSQSPVACSRNPLLTKPLTNSSSVARLSTSSE